MAELALGVGREVEARRGVEVGAERGAWGEGLSDAALLGRVMAGSSGALSRASRLLGEVGGLSRLQFFEPALSDVIVAAPERERLKLALELARRLAWIEVPEGQLLDSSAALARTTQLSCRQVLLRTFPRGPSLPIVDAHLHSAVSVLPAPVEEPRMTDLYPLPALPHLKLEVELEASSPAQLPAYKGSLLRGAWGHALRGLVCQMGPEQPCPTCSLRAGCIYPALFETLIEGDPPPFLQGLRSAPRPFVFEPEGDERTFGAGDRLRFRLVLVGRAVALQGYAVLALERMAQRGLGVARHRFELASVTLPGEGGDLVPGYDRAGRRWIAQAPARLPRVDRAPARAVIRFLTPTRIKANGHLRAEVRFRELVFRLLRRVLELATFHVPDAEVCWDFHSLLQQASGVNVLRSDLTWQDWHRYSNRQHQKMTLGGFVGEMEIEGDLAPFWHLLRTGEIVHVGKGATFGLGRMEVGGLQ